MPKDNNDLNQVFGEIRDAISSLNQKIDNQNQQIEELKSPSSDDVLKSTEEVLIPKKAPTPPPPSVPVSPSINTNSNIFTEEAINEIELDEDRINHGIKDKIKEKTEFSETLEELRKLEREVENKNKEIEDFDTPKPPSPSNKKEDAIDDYVVPKKEYHGALIMRKEEDEPKKSKGNIEEEIGVKWFAIIGMGILFLGISFFLKYAFDEGWISELGRVLMGVAAGLALIGIGEVTMKTKDLFGKVTSAGGLGVLYLSAFASYNFYDLNIPYTSALAFMGLVTILGVFLSLRYNSQKILVSSVLAGFLTPFLINSPESHQLGLFSYIALLDAGILVVSFLKKWNWLNLVGFVGTFFVLSNWFDRFYDPTMLKQTMLFLTLFFVMYSISSLAYNLFKKEKSTGVEQVMSLMSGILFFSTGYALMNPTLHSMMGFFAVIVALYYGLLAYLVWELTPKDENLYSFLGFLAISFASLAIPIQFSKYVITFSWTIEGVMLLILSTRVKGGFKDIVKFFGILIFASAIIRSLVLDGMVYEINNYIFLNKVFMPALFIIIGAYAVAYAYRVSAVSKEGESALFAKKAASIFLLIASLMTVVAVTRDINFYHKNLIAKANVVVQHESVKLKQLNNYRSITREKVSTEKALEIKESGWFWASLFWLVYGLVLMIFGIRKKEPALFWSANILVFFVLFKTVLQDMWAMDSSYRIFITLATILVCYVVVAIYKNNEDNIADRDDLDIKKTMVVLLVVINVVSVVFGSNEIRHYYSDRINEIEVYENQTCIVHSGTAKDSVTGRYISVKNNNYNKDKCAEYKTEIRNEQYVASVMLSIFWMLYAIVLLVIGFARNIKSVRLGAIILLIIAIMKLFVIDLWDLGKLYRIIAFTSLGLVLLVISFFYHKYKEKLKEII